jgi:hypothetical protein
MKRLSLLTMRKFALMMAVPALMFSTTACEDDNDDNNNNQNNNDMKTYAYFFNNGEVGQGTAYKGNHMSNLTADLMVESNGSNADITVTLNNTIDGEMYMVHAHDAADASTTPNGTPYNETPNSDVLVMMIEGNGGTVSKTSTTNGYSYTDITSDYSGFFVVHDPTQPVNTADISTYLVVGAFAREQGSAPSYSSKTYSYLFNTGQVAPAFAYSGSHATDFAADLTIEELANGNARVSVLLKNTISGETYPVHAHDKADPSTTPNGTPYDESPNADVMVQMVMGTGADAFVSQISSKSYAEITTNYEAFFVVHDPLQAITTTDPTTYVILGNFARE